MVTRSCSATFRFFTWVILAVNALFPIWIIAGLSGSADTSVALWAATDVILGVLWLITRRKTRGCPVAAVRSSAV